MEEAIKDTDTLSKADRATTEGALSAARGIKRFLRVTHHEMARMTARTRPAYTGCPSHRAMSFRWSSGSAFLPPLPHSLDLREHALNGHFSDHPP